jgi:preprotein translocase subunit SecF
MVIGIIVGSYSTIAVASPLVLIYMKWRGRVLTPQAIRTGSPRPAKAR